MDLEKIYQTLFSKDQYSLALWITLISVIACVFSLYYQYKVWHWPYVWGDLIKSKVDRLGGRSWAKSEQEYVSKVKYKYTVSNTTYIGNRLSAMRVVASHNAKFLLEKQLKGVERRGEQVKVYFNPKNPKKSFLIRGSIVQISFTLLYMIFMLFAFYQILIK